MGRMRSGVRQGFGAAAMATAAVMTASAIAEPPEPRPFLDKQDLFVAGDDPAHAAYHIPGTVVTAKGTVLAWCEGRRRGGDWDDIRLLLRRSTDDGVTWSQAESIAAVSGPKPKNPVAARLNGDPTAVTYNNPVLIADADGTVHMLFCLEYMRVFYQRSDDDGRTWTEATEITRVFDEIGGTYPWKVIATGPNHGIQLRTGRLVVPVWLSTGAGGNAHRPSVTATMYSDDHGATWHAGDIAVPCTAEWINPNETVAVERSDGSVMLNVRNESKRHRRLVTTSPNGATGWSEPVFDESLVEPICMAGLVRYDHGGDHCILFSNPDNLERGGTKPRPGEFRDRKNLSIRISRDDGRTWSATRSLEPGPSGYSDLAVTPAGTILCFYGRGSQPHGGGGRLTVARFNLAWILESK